MTGFQSLNQVLAELIKSWDVFEDDEQTVMFPLTPDRLAELPIPFRMAVLNAVLEDIRPNSQTPQTQN